MQRRRLAVAWNDLHFLLVQVGFPPANVDAEVGTPGVSKFQKEIKIDDDGRLGDGVGMLSRHSSA